MQLILFFLIIVLLLAALDLAALRWGVNSRRDTGDWSIRPNDETAGNQLQ